MSSELALAGFGKVLGITRHQLLIHPDISYTTNNSANCIHAETPDVEGLKEFCRNFLFRESQPDADTGFCLAPAGSVTRAVEDFGRRAKNEVVSQIEAEKVALAHAIHLEGLAGNHKGVIGALAAVGLRHTGNDGRFIWQPGKQLKDLQGFMTVGEVLKGTRVDGILTRDGLILGAHELIDLTDWVRAVLINGKTYILAEKNLKKSGHGWKTADKEYVRAVSS